MDMKVVVLAATKGGAGKTTLSAHLAVAAELTGSRTVLFDADPQQSLANWWRRREGDTPDLSASSLEEMPGKLKALAGAKYKVAMIDTPGSDTPAVAAVMALADLVLIPVGASPLDLNALSPTLAMVRAAGRPFRFIMNGVNPRGRLTAQAIAALSEHGAVARAFIGHRVAYVASLTDGRTCLETEPGGAAAAEIRALWTYVRTQLKQGV